MVFLWCLVVASPFLFSCYPYPSDQSHFMAVFESMSVEGDISLDISLLIIDFMGSILLKHTTERAGIISTVFPAWHDDHGARRDPEVLSI